MTRELVIPDLGEGIHEAQVVGVPVSVGDTVADGQTLLELEAGKAVLEVPAECDGRIEKLLIAEGETIQVGAAFVLVQIGEKDGAADNAEDRDADADSSNRTETEPVEESPAPPPASEPPSAPAPPTAVRSQQPEQSVSPVHHVPAAPSVRRFAREVGIDVDTVTGSGPHGRVSIEDVKRHARERAAQPMTAGTGLAPPKLPDFATWGPVRRERMSGVRAATARHVTDCWLQVPRVTHFDSADITSLDALRRKYADRAAAAGGKLTMAVMVVKVVSLALRRFPIFNASVDMARGEIVFKDYVHVGIAVATERGLLVPVLRDADRKNMVELAAEIGAVAGRCREGKIKPEELAGGTFTVTNLGSIGGTHFTPIVNVPEVAILGMGRAEKRPAVEDGTLNTRTMLPLSLSYDHRIIDGADAARFVRWIAEAVEEPLILALEG